MVQERADVTRRPERIPADRRSLPKVIGAVLEPHLSPLIDDFYEEMNLMQFIELFVFG